MPRLRSHTTNNPRGHWLCIAYAFPPINRSGTHRTLGFVRHLDRLGWDATVLTVHPEGEATDADLNDLVPNDTRIVRTDWTDLIAGVKRLLPGGRTNKPHATALAETGVPPARTHRSRLRRLRANLREWGSRLLMTPDSRIGWIIPGVRAALKTIRQRRPDVIYSTSPYMSAHLIAMIASVLTHIPWVADFRDPWRDNPYRRLGFRSLNLWDASLEWLVLRLANHVICNTPTMWRALIKRRPFVARKSSTILNGFDTVQEIETQTLPGRKNEFVMLHCGQFYGLRRPHCWLDALRLAIELDPIAADPLRLVLVGSKEYDGTPLTELAEAAGVADRVRILGPCDHAKAILTMHAADALILAGSPGTTIELQIPNKLYEYLTIRKPIIATAAPNSPTLPILIEAKAHALVCQPDDTNALARAMLHAVRHDDPQRSAPRPGGVCVLHGDWSGVDRFTREHRAKELAQCFQQLTGIAEPAQVHLEREKTAPAQDLRRKPCGELQEPAMN